jgi:hypothetical protein
VACAAVEELLELLELPAGVITTGVFVSGKYKSPFRPQPDTNATSTTTGAIRSMPTPA